VCYSPVALGRTVIIPLLQPFKSFTSEEKDSLNEAKRCASRFLPDLLNISDEQAREMRSRAFALRNKVLEFFKLEQITEMADRMAENYGMAIVAAEMVQKLGN
jgi:hypothetical protein